MLSWTDLAAWPYLWAAYLRKQLWALWLWTAAKSDLCCKSQSFAELFQKQQPKPVSVLFFFGGTDVQPAFPLLFCSRTSCFKKRTSLGHNKVLFPFVFMGSRKRCDDVTAVSCFHISCSDDDHWQCAGESPLSWFVALIMPLGFSSAPILPAALQDSPKFTCIICLLIAEHHANCCLLTYQISGAFQL